MASEAELHEGHLPHQQVQPTSGFHLHCPWCVGLGPLRETLLTPAQLIWSLESQKFACDTFRASPSLAYRLSLQFCAISFQILTCASLLSICVNSSYHDMRVDCYLVGTLVSECTSQIHRAFSEREFMRSSHLDYEDARTMGVRQAAPVLHRIDIEHDGCKLSVEKALSVIYFLAIAPCDLRPIRHASI